MPLSRFEQKLKRKAEIFEKALNLFLVKGYADTKIVDIAEMCDMSMGLMFRYYNSKEELYKELLEVAYEKYSGLNRHLQPTGSVSETLKEMITFILGIIGDNSTNAKLLMLAERSWRNEIIPSELEKSEARMNVIEGTYALILSGQKAGEIKAGNARCLTYALWGALIGLAEEIAYAPETICPNFDWFISIIK